MRKLFRLLGIVLNAIVDIAQDKPGKRCYMTIYEAQKKLDKGEISIREYNEAFERREII